MRHSIRTPSVADAEAVSRTHLRAWLETYPRPGSGIDKDWIAQHLGHLGTAEGTAGWRREILATEREPHRVFCRIMRSDTDVAGFLYGHREDVVTLGPMYLLREAQGSGVAHRLMDEFLAWADGTAMRLWVSTFNERAIRFYTRYGFVATGERELWRGRLWNLRMARPAHPPHGHVVRIATSRPAGDDPAVRPPLG